VKRAHGTMGVQGVVLLPKQTFCAGQTKKLPVHAQKIPPVQVHAIVVAVPAALV
jgi:hypothetical protein